jgi:hypothetical protein
MSQLSQREHNRARMPLATAFIDDMREHFGPVIVKYAKENGHVLGGDMKCPACGRQEKHSRPAHNRYFAYVRACALKLKPKGTQYSVDSWHEYFKQRFSKAEEVKLPNGKVQLRFSIAEDDTPEFNEYAMRVEVWCNENNVHLEE